MMQSGRAAFASSGSDLGHRVRHREDDRVLRHLLDHLARDELGRRDADEGVGALEGLGERALLRVAREALLVGVHVLGPALPDDAGPVDHEDVLELHAVRDVEVRARVRGGARAREDDLHVLDLLARDLERVQERGGGDDGRPVLVVVEDGDAHALLELLLDVEALGGLDVLEVDPAEGGLEARRRTR